MSSTVKWYKLNAGFESDSVVLRLLVGVSSSLVRIQALSTIAMSLWGLWPIESELCMTNCAQLICHNSLHYSCSVNSTDGLTKRTKCISMHDSLCNPYTCKYVCWKKCSIEQGASMLYIVILSDILLTEEKPLGLAPFICKRMESPGWTVE